MKRLVLAFFSGLAVVPGFAQEDNKVAAPQPSLQSSKTEAKAPTVNVGDSWSFQDVVPYTIVITAKTPRGYLARVTADGLDSEAELDSNMNFVVRPEVDPKRRDLKAQAVPGGIPLLQFPLHEQKTWSGDYVATSALRIVNIDYKAQVIGRETITLIGESCSAWKIQLTSKFHEKLKASGQGIVSGDMNETFWYCENAKNIVQAHRVINWWSANPKEPGNGVRTVNWQVTNYKVGS